MPIAAFLPIIGAVLDKIIPDKKAAAQAKLELLKAEQLGEMKEIEAGMAAVVAEANSEHSITATWRPIVMLIFAAVIANNYLVYPYLSLFWTDAPSLALPPEMWNLLKIGLGGYVFGRSAEKFAKNWKESV